MKTEHDTIEDVFTPAKQSGLTASEQSEMWNQLKSYAEYHQPVSVAVPKKKWSYFNPKMFVGIAASLVLFMSTGIAADRSLPGEALYGIKVEVMEPVTEFSKTTEQGKLEYNITKLQRRLAEVKQLEEEGSTESESVTLASSYVTKHVNDIIALINESDNQEISHTQVLSSLTEASGVVRAHGMAEDGVYKDENSVTEEVLEDLDVAFGVEAAAFAKENPADALSYIESIVEEVDDTLTASSSEAEKNKVNEDLEEVADSLKLGELTDALSSISEIKEDRVFEEYSE